MSNYKYEVERLNKTVNDLREQLFESEAENKKLKLELECVLELLKKAWAGDRIASMHITNILNNAEVNNLKQQSEGEYSKQVISEKQDRDALLRSRSEYLNQEFAKTSSTMNTMPVSCNTTKTMSRPSSSVLRRPMSNAQSRPGSGRILGIGVTRRARSAVSSNRTDAKGGNCPAGNQFEVTQANERLELCGLRPSNMGTRYDDPNRYVKDGLYSNPKAEGKGKLAGVPFVYDHGLLPNGSPRVHAAQMVAARRQGRVPASHLVNNQPKRPPSGIVAVHDRPLKNETQYYEGSLNGNQRQPTGRLGTSPEADQGRPKSSSRGIRFADNLEDSIIIGQDLYQADSSEMSFSTGADDKKRRTTLAIQRRIGIADNAIVVPR